MLDSTTASPVSSPTVPPPKLTRFDLWWRHLVACAFPALVALAMLVTVVAISGTPRFRTDWRDILLFVGVAELYVLTGLGLGALLIHFRRKAPLAVAIGLSQLITIFPWAGGYFGWAVVSLATRRKKVEIAILTLCALAWPLTGLSLFVVMWLQQSSQWPQLLVCGLLVLLILASVALYVALGFYVGARRELIVSLTERATTAERAQQLKVEQARNIERARIAREMHDVVAHRISLVSMNAGVLAYREDLPPERRQDIARTIQENSSLALTELRSVLAQLRQGSIEEPQPVLRDFQALFAESRSGGMQVSADVDLVDEDSLAPNVSRHAYRTLQEALTNARKHAVNAVAKVTLKGAPGEGLTMEVRNPLTSSAHLPSAGLGLIGLAERAEIVGGTFWAGEERGEFVVKAWYPWEK